MKTSLNSYTAAFLAVAMVVLPASERARAQTMSDYVPVSTGKFAEIKCDQVAQGISRNAEQCVDALEAAIKEIASRQLEQEQDPAHSAMYMAYGLIGKEIQVPPGQSPKMGRMAVITGFFEHIRDKLTLDRGNLKSAVLEADRALRGIYTYANAGNFGINPDADLVRDTLIRLAAALQRELNHEKSGLGWDAPTSLGP